MKTPLVRTALFHAPADVPRAAVPAQPETGPWFGEGLATRQAVDVLLDGASGAGSLLLNTKASQEAACSRAPAAIVPGQKPESRDAGMSGDAENGSHPAEADAAESHAGHAVGPGSSRNVGIGSHPAETDTAEDHAGQVGGPGDSGNAGTGSHLAEMDAAEDHAGQVGGPGSSRNVGIGSHLAETDTAEDHAGQVGGLGSSRNAGTGSHLAEVNAAESYAGQAGGSGDSAAMCAVADKALMCSQ